MIRKLPKTTILTSSDLVIVAVHDGETVHKTTLGGLLREHREHIPWLAVSPQFKWLCPWMPTLPHDYPFNPDIDLLSDMSERVFVDANAIRPGFYTPGKIWNIWALVAWPWGFVPSTDHYKFMYTADLAVDLTNMQRTYISRFDAWPHVRRIFGLWLS